MLEKLDLCFVIYTFLSNNPSSGDINSSNLSCLGLLNLDILSIRNAYGVSDLCNL